jgi:hypothetical protein
MSFSPWLQTKSKAQPISPSLVEKTNAVQIESSGPVDVRQASEDSQGVCESNAINKGAARKGKAKESSAPKNPAKRKGKISES